MRGRAVSAVLLGILFVGALAVCGCSRQPAVAPAERPSSAVATTSASAVSADAPATAEAIAAAIESAFGSALATVSVESTTIPQIVNVDGLGWEGFRVAYRLVGSDTQASSFVTGVGHNGLVPPISDLGSPADRMDAARLAKLLRAYGQITTEPFGALENYSTAQEWESASVRIAGRAYPIRELWVVTPGALTKSEFVRTYSDVRRSGYIFWFPEGKAPLFVGPKPGIGEVNDSME